MFDLNKLDFYHVIQPIVNLDNNKPFGYEFLLRSKHVQNPEELFRNAERQSKLVDLDMKSVSTALEMIVQKLEHLDGSRVFINIFPQTLLDPGFYKCLHKILSNTNLEPRSIVLEICEVHSGIDISKIKEVTTFLKKQGFIIALDDIGKGDSTMRSLIEIEPNVAKVDRYFSQDLSKSSKKQEFINFLLKFLDRDIPMVLEGFESKEDLQTAKELGVSFGQGFYLGKPKPLNNYLR